MLGVGNSLPFILFQVKVCYMFGFSPAHAFTISHKCLQLLFCNAGKSLKASPFSRNKLLSGVASSALTKYLQEDLPRAACTAGACRDKARGQHAHGADRNTIRRRSGRVPIWEDSESRAQYFILEAFRQSHSATWVGKRSRGSPR